MGENKHMSIHHAVTTVKVSTGGVAVAGTTYAAVDWITQAQDLATLAATVMTALYFAAMAIRACVGIYHDIRNKGKVNVSG